MKYIPFTLLLLSFSFSLSAQEHLRQGKDYAYFFYADYFSNGWQSLPETKTEVQALAKELQDNYNFQVKIIEFQSKQQVKNEITRINEQSQKGDQVLFFFSSHGAYNKASDEGFLVPSNGLLNDPYGDTWISYAELGRRITLSPAKHVLLTLDACHSGAFGNRWKGGPDGTPWEKEETCEEKVKSALKYKSRLYFTSGSKEQRTPANSLFASRFLACLRKEAGRGVISTNEIRYYLGSIENPEPEGGTFKSNHEEGGDFIFVHKNACRPALNIGNAQQDQQAWQAAERADTKDAYLNYKRDYPNGDFIPLANRKLEVIRKKEQEIVDWQNAKAKNTPEAYQQFIDDYSNSAYIEVARIKMEAARDLEEPRKEKEEAVDIPPHFIPVKGGTFEMGSKKGDDDEKPVHTVTLSDYQLARYEVTNEAFVKFLNDAPVKVSGEDIELNGNVIYELYQDRIERSGNTFSVVSGYDQHPIVYVTWYGAVEYCNWLSKKHRYQPVYTINGTNIEADWKANGYRLPTEAEWEYAARDRGGDLTWAGTSSESVLRQYANYSGDEDGYSNTSPVGALKSNGLGLYDMSGNVWEWCWDWYGDYPNKTQGDPKGPTSGSPRVFRGGSWILHASRCRSANRNCWYPISRSFSLGFRLARSQ